MLGFIVFGMVGLEIWHYFNYRKLVEFVKQKRDLGSIVSTDKDTQIHAEWMENFIKGMSREDLHKWIKETMFMYNKGFHNIDSIDEIPKEKMLKWVAYHVYFKHYDNISDFEKDNTQKILQLIENRLEYSFSDNENKIYFKQFGINEFLDNYKYYKPLIFYLFTYTVKKIVYLYLKIKGFKKYKTNKAKIVYFYYTDKNIKRPTLLFLHGLGFGITPYLKFILKLRKNFDIIIPIIPNLSNMEYTPYSKSMNHEYLFPSYETWQTDILGILIKHNIDRIDIIGHSFGTLLQCVLLKNKTIDRRTDRRIFIDPICFIDDCFKIYNYVDYPTSRNNWIIKIGNYLVYNDVYLKYVGYRFVFGPAIWVKDYNSMANDNNLVVLSKMDEIVPVETLFNRLTKQNIPCVMIKDAYHADIFLKGKYKEFSNILDIF